MITNGSSAAYTLSGDCVGTSVQTSLPAYSAATYDATPIAVLAVDKIQMDSISSTSRALAACNQIYNSNEGNQVFNDFFNPNTKTIVNKGGNQIWEFYSNQAALPTSVTVGSTGVIYTSQSFNGASSTTGTPSQTATYSYSVAADTATTLLVTFTNAGRDGATSKAIFTDSITYRLNANNTLTPLSKAITTTADLAGIGALSITGTVAAAPTSLNAGAAQTTFLSASNTATFNLLNNGEQCGTVNTNSAAINGSRTAVSTYATTISDSSVCSDPNILPTSESKVYGTANQLISNTIVGSFGTQVVTAASTPPSAALPASVTVGSTGLLYNYSVDRPAGTTGNVAYFVGANLSVSALTLYEVVTQTNASGFVERRIVSSGLSASNTLTPAFAYFDNRYTLAPN